MKDSLCGVDRGDPISKGALEMSRAALLILTTLLACSHLTISGQDGAAPQSASDRELLQLEEQWGRAVVKGDTAFFQRVLADDFIEVITGKTLPKSHMLEALKRPPGDSFSTTLVGMQTIRHYASATVISGLVEFPNKRKGSTPKYGRGNTENGKPLSDITKYSQMQQRLARRWL
jgi:Domain of unknown function (DUF4440)